MKKAAIIQSSYIPWKGFFDIIHDVDVFVFLEDVQYTRRDWRNRNRIKTPKGVKWITVPVAGSTNQLIHETKIDNLQNWRAKHKKMIHHSHASCEYYHSYKDDILGIYEKEYDTISELNIRSIKKISRLLDITTEFVNSVDLSTTGKKDDKLIEICQKIGADHYLSGPAAKDYIDETKFKSAGIELGYKDYSGYPDYQQLWGEFDHNVSIIDVIFNCGAQTPDHIWGRKNGK